MSDNETTANGGELSDLLGNILANRELMETIAGIVGSPSDAPAPKASEEPKEPPTISNLLSDPEVMAKLPEVMAVLRPIVSGENRPSPPPKKEGKTDAATRRIALLYALKPYLSPRRCEAIDYIARMSKMGDMMKNIKF